MHKISPSGRDDIFFIYVMKFWFRLGRVRIQTGGYLRRHRFFGILVFPIPNPAKPEPKIFVRYSPVIPLISGNPVTNISLIFLDRFVEDLSG
uniref:Uncharacterized protein n=1 Tax=Candidatus Kentrum sp. LPFa TaxID=2126335 RepID=A0A450VZM2_9GAMM|nr:MAG: hypothetical protein BECKLPF1236A_GA0070988_1003414 [Candidatus Kentron sp. LPFa]